MAVQAGVVQIFDRVMSELSLKIKRLDIDQTELACLKAIIVFNPGEFHRSSLTSVVFWLNLQFYPNKTLNRLQFLIRQMFVSSSAAAKSICFEQRFMRASTSTVGKSIPTKTGALHNSSFDCPPSAPSALSAWIICSTFGWSMTSRSRTSPRNSWIKQFKETFLNGSLTEAAPWRKHHLISTLKYCKTFFLIR